MWVCVRITVKGHEKSLSGDEVFYILNIGFLHEGLHLPKMHFIAYKLYFNKLERRDIYKC